MTDAASDQFVFDPNELSLESETKDFLYVYYCIASNKNEGNWAEAAESVDVDPYKFIDAIYDAGWPDAALAFLHEAAAVTLLSRLYTIGADDEDSKPSGSIGVLELFGDQRLRIENEEMLRTYHAELFRIEDAFTVGRIVREPHLTAAFEAGLSGSGSFRQRLQDVFTELVRPAFARLDVTRDPPYRHGYRSTNFPNE